MQRVMTKLKKWWPDFNSVVGFFILSVFLITLKTYWAYQTAFSLGAKGVLQQFLLVVNPLPTAIVLFGIALYFRGRIAYWLMILLNFIQSAWLFANMLYYREFTDFISLNIAKTSGSLSLEKAINGIIQPTDFLVFLDIIILIILLAVHWIKIDPMRVPRRVAMLTTILGIVLMGAFFGVASKDRSGLLTRTFDNNYIVKYLGLNEYAAYNLVKTHEQANEVKQAKASDLDQIKQFVNENKTLANSATYGQAKGKNVIIFHLESFQQFLLDYRWEGQEVTPNLNAFYHDQNTTAFDNFYNEVGQGKTADAELMLETSLFGTSSGSAMTNYGTNNTFQAMPALLKQEGNYTSAAFHGDVGSFWNRDNTYKNWGYDYFFSKAYYQNADNPDYNVGYGMKDKIFLKDTANYMQQLPQPFYSKVITVTNHYPYDLDDKNISINKTNTDDKTVDGYVQTARYLDQAFGEFEQNLKDSGLWDNSMIVLYGDHYGISDNHKDAIAKLIGKKDLTPLDLTNWQKVPLMIRVPGMQGGINHTYGGEIDVMPTLLGLLGIQDSHLVGFGQDLLSAQNKQIVPFRNGNWVSSEYTKYGSNYYVTATGTKIDPKSDPRAKVAIDAANKYVETSLRSSDKIVQGNLLRFLDKQDVPKNKTKDLSYKKSVGMKKLKHSQKDKTSVAAQNDGNIFAYQTDAPELGGDRQNKQDGEDNTNSTDIATPESILNGHGSDHDK
ncbi:LTA synthase family protein [Weissella kandleri]|uniref:LTA synthase family protein n=1 Tax=Weissella kandleri TaxID=1616 RepID=UPI00387E4F87